MHMSLRKEPEPELGNVLRELRRSLGLTQRHLADFAGYSTQEIGRWERGQVALREPVLQYLLTLRPPPATRDGAGFTFIDLFAGIGGFRKGFEAAGGTCVFTSERDIPAQTTYKANFGDQDVHGDITKIEEGSIPDHDILLAGFPCQPFSIAGVSKKNALGRKHGFDCETQGTLFFDIERIIAEKRPKAFVLENVKNLASHDGGRTFDVIKRTLSEKLGYRVSWKILDARLFVPQHRERVFIVGTRSDLGESFDWSDLQLPEPERAPRLSSILHPEDGSEVVEERFLDKSGKVLPKYILTDNLWTYLKGYAAKHKAAGNGFGFGLVGPDDVSRTLSARYFKDGSEVLIRRGRGNPRRLTPRECARLMGFDRLGQQRFKIVVSDTQAYRQFGNSVCVPLVAAVAKALVPRLAAIGTPTSTRTANVA